MGSAGRSRDAATASSRFHEKIVGLNLLAPLVAGIVLFTAAKKWPESWRWATVQATACAAALCWALSLAAVGGRRPLSTKDAPGALADGLERLPDGAVIGVLAALGALTVPLVLSAVRDACGDVAARRYAPVVALSPYAIWVISIDVVAALLGAGVVVAGVKASRRDSAGWRATGWAATAGLLAGLAALCSYAAAWLGLCVVCVYFARRRAALNLATGAGVLVPIGIAQLYGFGWLDGLRAARGDLDGWLVISLVTLLIAAGPPLVASLRKVRNTPAWPFLAGAGAAVVFALLTGLAQGGVEHAWLAFFPWLTVAAVAPERPAGPPPPAPLLLTGAGAVTAIALAAILTPP